MAREKVMNLIRTLARSQCFYGRLLCNIEEAETNGADLSGFFGQFQNCKDDVDVVLAIEE